MAIESISNVSPFIGNIEYMDLVIEGASGDAFAKGSLLVYNPLTGRMKAYSGASTEKPSAVVPVAFTMPVAGYVTKNVAVAGEFNGSGLSLPGTTTLDTVLQSSASAIAITAGGSNTGDGVAGTITQGDSAVSGTYTLTCSDASVSGSEVFTVLDPSGYPLPNLTVAAAYDNEHFAVTIADGATDFIVGDTFTVVPQVYASGSLRMMLKENGLIVRDVIQMYE